MNKQLKPLLDDVSFFKDFKIINSNDPAAIISLAIKTFIKKPCMYLSTIENSWKVIKKSLRFKNWNEREMLSLQLDTEGWALLIFETDEKRDQYFKLVDGDDTDGCIYARTFDSRGQTLNTNT